MEEVIQHYGRQRELVAPEPLAQRWIAEVFLGLEHVHVRMRALLRDLKHENVGLDSRGRAKLLDFGLGRLDIYSPNQQWTFGHPPGTAGWAAPEVFLEQAYNFACDFYSLGVLLWVLRTGGMGNGQPPKNNYGRSRMRSHVNDRTLLIRCIENPRQYGVRPIEGDAMSLAKRLTMKAPRERGKHMDIRSYAFLEAAELPDPTAGPTVVKRWFESRPPLNIE